MKVRNVYVVTPRFEDEPDYEVECDYISYTEYGFVSFKDLVVNTPSYKEYRTTLLLPSDSYYSIKLKGEN